MYDGVIDQRIRPDGDASLNGTSVLDTQLQQIADQRPDLCERAKQLRLRPLVIEIEDRAWTLWRDETLHVAVGDLGQDAMRLRTTGPEWDALVRDEVTPIGWMTANTLDLSGGRIGHLLDWWLLLRSLLDDRPVHNPGDMAIDISAIRSFSLCDPMTQMRDYLAEFGYLHIEGVFGQEEMDALSRDMNASESSYVDGDGNSWWATVTDGTRRLVRMQDFDHRSDLAARILNGDRLVQIAAIPGLSHENLPDRPNRIEALVKPVGVVGGISDVPWHKDCSLGRHTTSCCSLTVGISVSGAGPDSGQLRVIPGSHRAHIWPALLDVDSLGLPNLALPTRTGDVTVHLSCTLHMAQPPTQRERRVMYTSFELPALDAEAARQSRAAVWRRREGAPLNASQ